VLEWEIEQRNGQNILISPSFPEPIPVFTYMVVDPAFSKADNADPRALVTVAVGMFPVTDELGQIYHYQGLFVDDYYYGFCDPDKIIDIVLQKHVKYKYRGVVIEAVGGQLIFNSLMHNAMKKDANWFNNPFTYIPVPYQPMSKHDRILADIQPKCKAGLFFIKPHHHELESELKMFTRNKKGIHLLDAIQMGNRFYTVCREEVRTHDPKKSRLYKEASYVEDLEEYGYQLV
jgi:hypothetical protein